jgi:hypothetical protein
MLGRSVTLALVALILASTSTVRAESQSIYIVELNGDIGVYNAATGVLQNSAFAHVGSISAGLAFDNQNHLFATDYFNNRVQEFNATTGALENANFITSISRPWGITADDSGHLYVASPDAFGGSVAKFSVSGTTATTISLGFIQGLNTIETVLYDRGSLYTGSYFYLAKWDATSGSLITYSTPGSFKEGMALYGANHTIFTQNVGYGVYEYSDATLGFSGRIIGPAVGNSFGSLGVIGNTLYSATGGTMQTFDLISNQYANVNFVSGPVYDRFVIGPAYHAVPEPGSLAMALSGTIVAMVGWTMRRAMNGERKDSKCE